jgi:hypothetical protein
VSAADLQQPGVKRQIGPGLVEDPMMEIDWVGPEKFVKADARIQPVRTPVLNVLKVIRVVKSH